MTIQSILSQVQANQLSIEQAIALLSHTSVDNFAVLDTNRQQRTGISEVIYGENKNIEQLFQLIDVMHENNQNIFVTRLHEEKLDALSERYPAAQIHKIGRTFYWGMQKKAVSQHTIAVVSAGTSDLPVVEECVQTIVAQGYTATKIVDVGVAGIHRLFHRLDDIKQAAVVIVVAGMEGALASVVGGLVDSPVIAVPTSVGYGASFGGVSALLTMLNSCASGITVVNIDNGFGAAIAAIQIIRAIEKK